MNIIITDIANLDIFLLPVVPANLSIVSAGELDTKDTKETKEHQITIINNEPPKTISWSSFFPVNKNYNFVPYTANQNGWAYVAFFELMKKYNLPIRIIITTKNKVPILNTLAGIKTLTYSCDKAGDINYTLNLTEFYEKFYQFIPRDKEVFKYVRELNIKQFAKDNLQKFGLLPK